jgi:hypothetical protein
MKLLMFHVVIIIIIIIFFLFIFFFFNIAYFGFWFTPVEKCLFCSLRYVCFPKEIDIFNLKEFLN